MAYVQKCDRCGMLDSGSDPRRNQWGAFKLQSSGPDRNVSTRDGSGARVGVDLCPTCTDEVLEWWKEGPAVAATAAE